MFSEDLEHRRAILSWFIGVRRNLEIMVGFRAWCGRKGVTERRRHWETQRMWPDSVGGILYGKKVVTGVAMSGDVAWLY
jgi:hypothetical protein